MPYNQSVLPHTGRFASVNEERSDADIPNVGGWKDIAPRHSMAYRMQHRVRNTVIYVLVAALAFVGTAAAATLLDINGTIKDGEVKIIPQKGQKEPKLIDPNAGKPIELLVMGQDTRDGADNASIGGGDTSEGSHQAGHHHGGADLRGPQLHQSRLHSARLPGGRAKLRNQQGHDQCPIQRDVQLHLRQRLHHRRRSRLRGRVAR